MRAYGSVRLSDVATVFNGKTPSRDDQRPAGHPVLKIRDVDEAGLFRGRFDSYVDDDFASKFPEKGVRSGDTLILNAAHNADYVGSKQFFARPSVDGALATGEWLIVRPDGVSLDGAYAHYWLTAPQTLRIMREMVKGIHLYPKDVSRLSLGFLPPLDEQQRIAAILDKADALLQKRKRAIALLDSLAQSIFVEMFGDCKPDQGRWSSLTVAHAGRVQLGRQRAPKYQSGNFTRPYVRVANVYEDRIDTRDVLSMDFDEKDFLAYRLEMGDILLNEGQSTELVGRPAAWNGEVQDCCFQNTLVRWDCQ